MLLKDAKRTLRQLAEGEPGSTLEAGAEDAAVVRLPLAGDSKNQAALFYIVRRGKGNASVFAWAYVSIWSVEPFAEPSALELEVLNELPAKHRENIKALRLKAVHEFAFLSPNGHFTCEHAAFRPETQIVEWTVEDLRSDFTAAVARGREFVQSLPSEESLAYLLAQRKTARARMRGSEA